MSNFWSQWQNSAFEAVTLCVVLILQDYYKTYYTKQPRNESIYAGERWLTRLLDQGYETRVRENLRMDRSTFLKLCEWLQEHTSLKDSRRVSAKQKLAIFFDDLRPRHVPATRCGALPALAGNDFKVNINSTFNSLLMELYRCFHEVLLALLRLHEAYVRLPAADDPIPPRITESTKYRLYFKDCLGTLDDTHIDAFISGEPTAPYRDRRGKLSQNVLAVCTFDLQFSYILAGWEGSAHDSRVLRDAITHHGFSVPAGKYFLRDAAGSDRLATAPIPHRTPPNLPHTVYLH
jgi:hypothetical protein